MGGEKGPGAGHDTGLYRYPCSHYRGTSLTKIKTLGPYRRPMPRVMCGS